MSQTSKQCQNASAEQVWIDMICHESLNFLNPVKFIQGKLHSLTFCAL